jgi:hypothetical protein
LFVAIAWYGTEWKDLSKEAVFPRGEEILHFIVVDEDILPSRRFKIFVDK